MPFVKYRGFASPAARRAAPLPSLTRAGRERGSWRRVPGVALLLATSACGSPAPSQSPANPEPAQQTVDVASVTGARAGQAALAALLEPLRSAGQMPALAALVIDDQKLLASAAVGNRQLGGDPIQLQDTWLLGANAAAMTATLAAKLVDEDLINWDLRIADLISDDMQEAYAGVSLQELLRHRAGFAAQLPADLSAGLHGSGSSLVEQRQWLALQLLRLPPALVPGHYAYSGPGYVVAASLLERAAAVPWETLLDRKIFDPLQMTSCGLGLPPLVRGHLRGPDPTKLSPLGTSAASDEPLAVAPAGGVHCSIEDWGRFVQSHLKALRGSSQLLRSASFAMLHVPPEGGRDAMGWSVVQRDWAQGRALTQAGSSAAFYSVVWIAPGVNRAYLAVTNRGDAFESLQHVVEALRQRYPGEGS